MHYKILFTFLLLGITAIGVSQEENEVSKSTYTYNQNKGKAYIYWGWNRSYYTKSDIHFKGDNYDFTLDDVHATDRQSKVTYRNYLQLDRITIPQTNFRIGYYIKDNYQISFGFDHMKYVVTQPQNVTINGHLNLSNGEGDTSYNGIYNNATINLDNSPNIFGDAAFFRFEHTDGLNYINVELARVDDLGEFFNLNPKKIQINAIEGLGIGALYPKTNATIIGKPRNDEFHWSGYGVSAKAGLGIVLFNHVQIQGELKGGFINMPWIKTTADGDSAKQKFWFLQHNITFGYVFQLFNNTKKKNIDIK